jgi:hypothetical protein
MFAIVGRWSQDRGVPSLVVDLRLRKIGCCLIFEAGLTNPRILSGNLCAGKQKGLWLVVAGLVPLLPTGYFGSNPADVAVHLQGGFCRTGVSQKLLHSENKS